MASPVELWLIRHGETAWTLSGQHTSRTDLPLTPEGERSAKGLKKLLHRQSFALILSSPLRRAVDTCRLAGYTPELTTDLDEWDYGEYEGRTTAQIQEHTPGWSIWTSAPRGGETIAQVGARADRVIARGVSAPGDVALFGHGHMLRILAARWLGLEPRAGRLFALSPDSISVLGYEHDTRVIRVWNRTEDLAGAVS